jgi:CheY-like chemotaxis protein
MAQILVVAQSPDKLYSTSLLWRGGYDLQFANGFDAATRMLERTEPALLISEVRLGSYNALHLVIRSQRTHPKMRSILVDRAHDPVIEVDAIREGASYLVQPSAEDLLDYVARLLAESTPQRRWPRKLLAEGLDARVARRPARVVELSYGGMRLELQEVGRIPSRFQMKIPSFDMVVRARPIWTHYSSAGSLSCGAELSEGNPKTLALWRHFVDTVQDTASHSELHS